MNQFNLKPGSIIEDRYEVIDTIGEGGFGVVFKGKQISTDQFVAIKVMHADRLDDTPESQMEIARFEREMKLCAQIKHPNVVRLIDTGQLPDGQLYTVLEFIQGEPLYDVIEEEQGLSPREAKQLMLQVCDALCSAHGLGVVHRDLKPQNIMVTDTGGRRNAMVLDFGIAGIVEDQRDQDYRTLTAEGNIRGTPAYMAPEQLESRVITPQTDIYAWGLVFLECLTGRPAVDGESLPAIIFQHMSPKPVPMPEALRNHKLGRIIQRALAKSLDERYPDARTVLDELEDCGVGGLSREDLASAEALATRNSISIPNTIAARRTEVEFGDTIASTSSRDLKVSVDSDLFKGPDTVRTPGPPQSVELERPPPSANHSLLIGAGVLATTLIVLIIFFLVGEESDGNSEGASLPESTSESGVAVADVAEGPAADAVAAGTGAADVAAEPSGPELPVMVQVPAAEVGLGVDAEMSSALAERFPVNAFDLDTTTGLLEPKRWERPGLEVMTREITWSDWKAHLDQAPGIENLCPNPLPKPGADDIPVTGVGAAEAEFFCKSIGLRLPTVQEWEALARGAEGRSFGFEGEMTPERETALSQEPTGQDLDWNVTPEGIYSLTGGVREWVTCAVLVDGAYCKDGYGHRGGSWKSGPFWQHAFVMGFPSESIPPRCLSQDDIGFRCVRSAE